jgi:hypothetical protein
MEDTGTLKSSLSLLSKIDDLLAKDEFDDDEANEPISSNFTAHLPLNVQKTLTPGESPGLPGDPELPTNPELPYDPELPENSELLLEGNEAEDEADQSETEDLFRLAEEVMDTQAWQQFRQQFEDAAPVE